MHRLSFLTVSAAFLTVGCATATPQADTASAPASRCGAPMAQTQSAWTVEGFGGKGDSQLMMTRRQPKQPCVSRDGAVAGGATLAANE